MYKYNGTEWVAAEVPGTISISDISGISAYVEDLLASPDAAGVRTALNVQTTDGDLTAIAALTPSDDDVLQRKSGAWTNRTLAQLKTDLQLQPLDGDLTAIAALTSAANKLPYATGAGTWAMTDLTSQGRSFLGATSASEERAVLGTQTCSNIAALKGIASIAAALGTSDGYVQVLGYYTSGDGGGGLFRWDSTDTTSTDNAGTIIAPSDSGLAATGRWKRIINGPLNVKWFGAKGDGTTDDTDALNAAFLIASQLATSDGQWVKVVIPAGIYRCDDVLYFQSNTEVENQGHLKFYGGDLKGQFCQIQNVQNLELHGGVWNSNHQYNDNTLALTYMDPGEWPQPQGGPYVENVFIHDMLIIGARAGIPSWYDVNDPAHVGIGGGKGITIQYGCKSVLISNVVIDDCDVGITVEGRDATSTTPLITDPGLSQNIVIQNTIIQNAKWMGLFIIGAPNSFATYASITDISLSNVELVDCGVGQYTFDSVTSDVSDIVGSLTVAPAAGLKGDIKIRSTTGRMTAVRGGSRLCKLELTISAVGELVNAIDVNPYGGFSGGGNYASRYNIVRAQVAILGVAFSGYLLKSNLSSGAASALWSRYEFDVIYINGTTQTTLPLANHANNVPTSTQVRVFDQNSGKTTTYNSSLASVLADRFSTNKTNTVTSAGTKVMTITDTQLQTASGSSTHVFVLPSAGVVTEDKYRWINSSSGDIDIQASDGSHIVYLSQNRYIELMARIDSPVTVSDWWISGARGSSSAVTSTLLLRDTNANALANAFLPSKSQITSSGGVTNLTIASAQIQEVIGSSLHTVKLGTTSVPGGFQRTIINNSTGVVTVQSSDSSTLLVMYPETAAIFQARIDTPTSFAHWAIYNEDIPNDLTANTLTTGESSIHRDKVNSALTLSTGILRLRYFTALKTEPITKLRTHTGNTAASATPTTCRKGVFSVASNGDLTLVASIANDTALWAATQTYYESALTSTWNKIAGLRYATGALCVTAGTAPTIAGAALGGNGLAGRPPRVCGSIGGQSNLLSSYAAGLVADSNSSIYVEMLP